MGGHGNVAAITAAMLAVLQRYGVDGRATMPWYFPTAEAYRSRLERAGFAIDSIAPIPRPTPLAAGMSGWLDTFAAPFLKRLPELERAAANAEVMALLGPVLCDDEGNWTADYVRLRFAARLPD